jgi:hypothetical protein
MGNSVNDALAAAQRQVDSGNDFSKNVTKQAGNTVDPTAPKKALAPTSDYTHAQNARKAAATKAAPHAINTGDELAAKQRQVGDVVDASKQ